LGLSAARGIYPHGLPRMHGKRGKTMKITYIIVFFVCSLALTPLYYDYTSSMKTCCQRGKDLNVDVRYGYFDGCEAKYSGEWVVITK
jgi:hypothetical protein